MAEPGLITNVSASGRDGFIADLRAAADRAADTVTGGLESRDFLIAGRRLRLELVPALVAPMTDALRHASVPVQGTPELTVRGWDLASTGIGLPPAPTGGETLRGAGALRAIELDGLHVLMQEFSDTITVLEPDGLSGYFWVEDAEALPFFERASPLCKLLHLRLADAGLQMAHASAITGPRGCVLLAGPAGAGKSSAALACLDDPVLRHLADDYCVIEQRSDDTPPLIHPLYSSAKANDDTLERLRIPPELIANPVRVPGEKAIAFLGLHRPEALAAPAPLSAIVVPVITGRRETRIVPADGGAALAALGPSTILQLPGTNAATLRALAAAARSAPCFRLEVGTDPASVPAALRELVG